MVRDQILKHLKKLIRKVSISFARITTVDLSIVFTLILLFFYTESILQIDLLIKVSVIIGILFFRFTKSPWYWFYISIVLIVGHITVWYSIDNHKYLMTWWCLAIAFSFYLENHSKNIHFNGRVLIGLCFMFATFWKLITPEFIDGSFFHYLLIGGDGRFDEFSMLLTGIHQDTIDINRQLINELKLSSDENLRFTLEFTERSVIIAHILTWWTIIIEGVIALGFLCKGNWFVKHYRDYLLGIFIITTYSVANVIEFAWLIIAMGVAQIDENNLKFKKLWYILLFIIMAFFSREIEIFFQSIFR